MATYHHPPPDPLYGVQPIQHRRPNEPEGTPDDLARVLRPWLHVAQDRALAKVRGPFLEAAGRLGMASARADELTDLIDQTRWRLANPRHLSAETFLRLEDRLVALEDALHRERAALWRDLLPLAERARDGAIESMRLAWLGQVAALPARGERP